MRHHPDPATFDELLAKVRDLPAGYRGQILDGNVHVSPPPSAARAHTIAEISAMMVAGSPLGDPVPEGWAFQCGAEIACGGDAFLVADIAGFRASAQELSRTARPIRIAPGWVCEVLCDRTRHFTLTAKRRAYAELGVGHLWIADPEAQVLEIFVNQRGKWLLHASLGEETAATVPPFEGLHFDAAELWIPSAVRMPVAPRTGTPPSSRRRGLHDGR